MKNWKTTLLGVLTLVAGIASIGIKLLNGGSVGLEDAAIIGAGTGLITAKDNNK